MNLSLPYFVVLNLIYKNRVITHKKIIKFALHTPLLFNQDPLIQNFFACNHLLIGSANCFQVNKAVRKDFNYLNLDKANLRILFRSISLKKPPLYIAIKIIGMEVSRNARESILESIFINMQNAKIAPTIKKSLSSLSISIFIV